MLNTDPTNQQGPEYNSSLSCNHLEWHFIVFFYIKVLIRVPVSSLGRFLSSLQQLRVWVRPVVLCCWCSHLPHHVSCHLSELSWQQMPNNTLQYSTPVLLFSSLSRWSCIPNFQSSNSIKRGSFSHKDSQITCADILHVLTCRQFSSGWS